MENGWIKIDRGIRDHWLWSDPRYLQWWLDLIMSANWKDGKVLVGSTLVEVKRGEMIASRAYLAARWGVGQQVVRNFISLLEKDSMLTKITTSNTTNLIICNYERYQDCQPTFQPTNNQPATNLQPTCNQPATTIKEYNKKYKESKEREEGSNAPACEVNEYEVLLTAMREQQESVGRTWLPYLATAREEANQLVPKIKQTALAGEDLQQTVVRWLNAAWAAADDFTRSKWDLNYLNKHFNELSNTKNNQNGNQRQDNPLWRDTRLLDEEMRRQGWSVLDTSDCSVPEGLPF